MIFASKSFELLWNTIGCKLSLLFFMLKNTVFKVNLCFVKRMLRSMSKLTEFFLTKLFAFASSSFTFGL